MKLQGAAGARFCSEPDRSLLGALLYGPDSGLIRLRRQALVEALSEGEELRVDRLAAGEIRKDPASVDTALRSKGFFPGRRVLVIEGAKDALAAALGAVLPAVTADDAFLVVEAENLPARAELRKLFEGSDALAAIGLYPDPPGRGELRALLAKGGCRHRLGEEAEAELAALASEIDRGQLLQLIEIICLYSFNSDSLLNGEEIRALSPWQTDPGLDQLIESVAAGRPDHVGPTISQLSGSGVTPVQMLIVTGRQFLQMLALSSAGDGVEDAVKRLRPPVFGPRARVLARRTNDWGQKRIEAAVRVLHSADSKLRSPGAKPDLAMVERALIRVAMLAPRR